MSEINTFNKYGISVGVGAQKVIMLIPPRHDSMTAEEAMVFAAWLVTCAQIVNPRLQFDEILAAIQNS